MGPLRALKRAFKPLAEAIKAHAAGKGEPQPFRYRSRGKLATVGRKAAVIAFGRLRLKGWIVW